MNRNTLVRLSLIAVVALLTSSASAQTFRVIHSFNGRRDGALPQSGVTLREGVLYGTTWVGVTSPGTVYQMKHTGSNWIFDTVYLFKGEEGTDPLARVVFGPDGRLYGTTGQGGGSNGLGDGAVFRLIPNSQLCRTANCFWAEETLHIFSGMDGAFPAEGDLIWDQNGNIYGTTAFAGFQESSSGNVYQLAPSENGWIATTLYLFPNSGPDARTPFGGVIFDKDGNLWGTTQDGGANDKGAIFELKYVPGMGWQESVVYSFRGDSDGSNPVAGLIADASGNFYGVTPHGGSGNGGTVFELSPSGDSWTFHLLHSFPGAPDTFCGPLQTLFLDSASNLYGTTYCAGANQQGNIFKLANTPNGWAYTSLYDFTGGSDGAKPISNVSMDTDGILYGTTSEGGSCADFVNGCGVVWMIKP